MTSFIKENLVQKFVEFGSYDGEDGLLIREIQYVQDLPLSGTATTVTVDVSLATSALGANVEAHLMQLSLGAAGSKAALKVSDTEAVPNDYIVITSNPATRATNLVAPADNRPLAVVPAGRTIDIRAQALEGGTATLLTYTAVFKIVPINARVQVQ